MFNIVTYTFIAMLTFSASPTENVPAKMSPPNSIPTTTTQSLTSPPAAYPIVLAGRPIQSNENKPKIPPPVPPRGTPKAKKTGINAKGAQHDDYESFMNSHDAEDYIALEYDTLLMADKYNCAYCDCNFNNLKPSCSITYISSSNHYYVPERINSNISLYNDNRDHFDTNGMHLDKRFASDDFSIDTNDYENYFRIRSDDSIYLPDENKTYLDKSMLSLTSDDFYHFYV